MRQEPRALGRVIPALRTAVERGSRRIVLKRRLPARFGRATIFVSPEAMLKLWWPSLERADESLFSWASEFVPGGATIWDVGANVGLFTFASAHLAGPHGHVVALEPDTWLVELLRRSTRKGASSRAHVDVVPAAVTASLGIASFNIAERSRASSFVEGCHCSTQAGGIRETQLVVSVTLDWLLERFPAPTVLKIDVEGAEDAVLRGGQRLLRETRPVILCEVAGHNAQTVGSLLQSQGYTLYDLQERGERQPKQLPAFNTLALPH